MSVIDDIKSIYQNQKRYGKPMVRINSGKVLYIRELFMHTQGASED